MSAESDRSMGDRDELDYNLTFPPAIFGGEVEPVVFLLGWLGSKDKTLAKYSSIYEKEGCITIRYIHHHKDVFFSNPSDSKAHQTVSVKLVQLLEDYDLLDNPVFVHVFSNGGFFVYRFLADVMQTRKIKTAGVIFDSCPSRLDYVVAVRAILHTHSIPSRFAKFMVTMAFTFYFIFWTFKRFLGFSSKKDAYQVMQESPIHHWPNLYLYSSADVIVPCKHIEEMADARLKACVPLVSKHNFGTSPHVMHFKKFPELYQSLCVDFLRQCLSLNGDGKLSDNRI